MAGGATGSTQPRRCAWRTTRSSSRSGKADLIQDGLRRGNQNIPRRKLHRQLDADGGGLTIQAGLVEWMTTMTYQAASGAGAAKMLELVKQMKCLHRSPPARNLGDALEVDRSDRAQRAPNLPTSKECGAPLAGSLLPWIAENMPDGQTREEWKGIAETNKILGSSAGARRRHLRARRHDALPQSGAVHQAQERYSAERNRENAGGCQPWVRVIPNNKESTLRCLTPTAVSGTLNVPIGRLHKLDIGPEFLGAFTVGDPAPLGRRGTPSPDARNSPPAPQRLKESPKPLRGV